MLLLCQFLKLKLFKIFFGSKIMNICQSFEKYQNDETFRKFCCKKLKLVQGNKEKTLDLYIPTIVLFDLDSGYFKVCMSGKFADTEVSYGIDDKLESFEGFEAFIIDYLSCNKEIKLDITDKLSKDKYQTALRFNKDNIYSLTFSFKNKSKFDVLISSITDKNVNIATYFYSKQCKGHVTSTGDDYVFNISLQDDKYVLKLTKDFILSTRIDIFIKDTYLGSAKVNYKRDCKYVLDNIYTNISVSDYGSKITIY